MALPSTDPSVLVNAARCYESCIPVGYQMAVQVYLLAIIAGQQNTSPSDLANAARCWSSCIPPGDQMAVGNYLLAQLLA
jgi:hypothetical protein